MLYRLALVCGAAVLLSLPSYADPLDSLSFDEVLDLALQGDRNAELYLAKAFEKGAGVEVDRAEAARWYRKAADEGDQEGMVGFGRILSKGAPGIEKNPEFAFKLFESAARIGNPEAQNWAGYSSQHGQGVEQSDSAAVAWFKKAADAGLPAGKSNLGLMYVAGKGLPRDYGKASQLFEQAAVQGDGWAANNLGGLYEMGWGVPKDPQKAIAYYEQASGLGIKTAGRNLARLTSLLGPTARNQGVQTVKASEIRDSDADRAAVEPTGEVAKPRSKYATQHPATPNRRTPARARTTPVNQDEPRRVRSQSRRSPTRIEPKGAACLFGFLCLD